VLLLLQSESLSVCFGLLRLVYDGDIRKHIRFCCYWCEWERESESLLFVCLFAFGVRRLAREPNGNTNNLFIPFHVLHFDAHMYTLSDIHRNTTHWFAACFVNPIWSKNLLMERDFLTKQFVCVSMERFRKRFIKPLIDFKYWWLLNLATSTS
jgi:hypothetical protein